MSYIELTIKEPQAVKRSYDYCYLRNINFDIKLAITEADELLYALLLNFVLALLIVSALCYVRLGAQHDKPYMKNRVLVNPVNISSKFASIKCN